MQKAGDLHYRAFVGPPNRYDLIGAYQFMLLIEVGLRENHKLLDIGCGSLRAGRLFIPYLNSGNYFGVEPEQWLVEEGIKNEVGEDLIQIKKPTFLYTDDWNFPHFDTSFDYLVAQSIFSHASQSQITACLDASKQCMKSTSLLAANFLLGAEDYQGSEWNYPGNVSYRHKTIVKMIDEVGLTCVKINGFHPVLTWYLIANLEMRNELIQWQRRFKNRGSRLHSLKNRGKRWLKPLWWRLPENIKVQIRGIIQKQDNTTG